MRTLRMKKQVQSAGTIHLEHLPLNEGQWVEVILLPVEDRMDDLSDASASALGFWDNEIDDRVWSRAIS